MLNVKQASSDDEAGPPEIIARFYAAIGGIGTIGGPYRPNAAKHPRSRPIVMWWADATDAAAVIAKLWPWLSSEKRNQWRRVQDRASL
jgi:hypothetical protein